MSDAELLQAYLVEARENIQTMEKNFLALEQTPGNTFSRFQRMVRDLAKDLSKEVELIISGRGDADT